MSAVTAVRRLLLVAVLALAVIPASASASGPGTPFDLLRELPPRLRAEVPSRMNPKSTTAPFRPALQLKPIHGYRVGVIGVGSTVVLEVRHGHASAITAYVARGTVTPGRLEASFGSLGSISMRFHPSSHRTWETPHRRCKGHHKLLVRRGVYVGSLRFRGEGGYISVHAQRAKGGVSTIAASCLRAHPDTRSRRAIRPAQGDKHLEFDALAASWRHGVDATSVGGFTLGSRVLFFASTEQTEGGLAILRFAFAVGSGKTLTVDDALTRAQIKPPAPFSGTGTYRAAPDGTTTWSGGLSVNFPGAPRLPLTGPEFKPELETGL